MDLEAIIIVGIVFGLPWLSYDYFKYKTKMKELESKLDKSEKVEFINEIASMKHRLITLEKIVTDKGYELKDEISRL